MTATTEDHRPADCAVIWDPRSEHTHHCVYTEATHWHLHVCHCGSAINDQIPPA